MKYHLGVTGQLFAEEDTPILALSRERHEGGKEVEGPKLQKLQKSRSFCYLSVLGRKSNFSYPWKDF